MFKRTITPTRTPDRLSYLWLATATALYLFTGGQWVIPLAAWLAPLFLLRFVRTQPPLPGLLLAWLVRFAVAAIFVLQGSQFPPGTPPGYYTLVLLVSLLSILPYLADGLITPRLSGFVATLVFPVAYTTFCSPGSRRSSTGLGSKGLPGARCEAVGCCICPSSPWSPEWGGTTGALPAASDPCPCRGSQPVAGGSLRVQPATAASDPVLATLR
jgi:hypothetical protein